jgi:hypothetical protein
MDATDLLRIFVRWLHISSVVTLIGGFIFARLAVWPELSESMVARFRAILYLVLATTLASGLYNYLTKPFYPPHYHMVIGIKFLFVLHIFAVAILYTMPNAALAKRRRWLTGMAISGLIVVAISAVLRSMTL